MELNAPPIKSKDGGYFQCGFCKRHYNRADHLIRHVRSHTREKPYVCDVCDKGFARPDLLKRHATGHANDRDRKRKRTSSIAKQSRVSQACKTCAASKLKCDEEKPCRRCRERNLQCDWQDVVQDSSPEPLQQPAEHSNPLAPSVDLSASVAFSPMPTPMDEFPSTTSILMTPQGPPPDPILSPELPTRPEPLPMEYSGHTPQYQSLYQANGSNSTAVSPTDQESGIFSVDGQFFPNFIPDSLISSLSRYNDPFDPSSLIPEFTHYGALESPPFDFNLTDGDFGLIDMYNSRSLAPGAHENDHQDRFDADSGIGIGAEAYHRSSLSAWKPMQEDRAGADHENLSVPQTIDSPEMSAIPDRQILCERLSSSSRDLIFGLVLEISREANLTRIMKSFPSTELLDGLIQRFFEIQINSVDSFIHAPTFRPNNEHASILAAMAAAGAVRSPIPTIRKLGFALLEIVRLYMPIKYESDNSTTRDLRTSQTYALNIDIGIWSGNRRKTEIAESFSQPLITMLRRALRFRRSVYPTIVLMAEDVGDALERKWYDWIEQESFKRLVYHVFLHDAQSAVTLNVNPLISYADLELPLPAARHLWEAKSAVEWKELYHAITPERVPSLADLLRDMSQLSLAQDRIGTQMAALSLLHGLAGLINEYHRLKFISSSNSKHWHALVTNSRQQELDQALQHFRMVCSELRHQCRPEIILVCEVVSMLLHMSLEELQLFAGKEDKQEARRVYHSALEWITSSDSRRAIWHAGQIVRAARQMAPGSLTGFLAIGVYYASLAFWSYGVVSKAKNVRLIGRPSSPVSALGPTVFLDAEEVPDVSKFVTLGCGLPALQSHSGPIYLADSGMTMRLVQTLLRPDSSERTPPLVQSLAQLMGDLAQVAPRREYKDLPYCESRFTPAPLALVTWEVPRSAISLQLTNYFVLLPEVISLDPSLLPSLQ
ncbi:hypothetical protein N7532_007271 [Penicillium argentinense]|uniref:Uncharacterized protein n=1 Tax=Penicillium argentinense TaxID=1131581 RepID=A0A9W9K6W4_9EURO|nr:uncharacterized protein N7532_007271 [Penicillium argentinense]KAJ5094980.1 hypothetical protein N7532_007271 [Penicillium argentinense]